MGLCLTFLNALLPSKGLGRLKSVKEINYLMTGDARVRQTLHLKVVNHERFHMMPANVYHIKAWVPAVNDKRDCMMKT